MVLLATRRWSPRVRLERLLHGPWGLGNNNGRLIMQANNLHQAARFVLAILVFLGAPHATRGAKFLKVMDTVGQPCFCSHYKHISFC